MALCPKIYLFREEQVKTMWTVVYLANSIDAMNSICCLLDKNGIIYRAQEIGKKQEDESSYFNVLVPSAEVSKAHALILDEEL